MQARPPEPLEPASVRALKRGDPAAWDLLYADYSPRVLGYLLRLCANRSDAEDLLQETFLAAYAGRTGYGGRSQPLAWLLGIARRRWRDSQRYQHPTEPEADEMPAPGNFTDLIDADDAASALLAHLPLSDREIVVLSVVQGLSYREVAAIVEKPVGTVKWRAAESLRRLRELSVTESENPNAHEATRTKPRNATRSDDAPADRQPARPARPATPQADCP